MKHGEKGQERKTVNYTKEHGRKNKLWGKTEMGTEGCASCNWV